MQFASEDFEDSENIYIYIEAFVCILGIGYNTAHF